MINKILIACASLLFLGCASFEKHHFKATQFFLGNKDKLADLCASEFPSVPKYIKGDEVVKYDTIINPIEVLVDCPDGTKAECPKQKTVFKEVFRTDTIVKPDTAREDVLRQEINKLNASNVLLIEKLEDSAKQLKQAKKETSKRDWIILGLGAILALFLICKIKR